jgi:hypothetical protein
VVIMPDGRITSVFRVDGRENIIQTFSSTSGRTWENISKMDAWAVMPQLQALSNGVVVLTSGCTCGCYLHWGGGGGPWRLASDRPRVGAQQWGRIVVH